MICEEDITSEDIFVISDMNITSEEHIKKDNKSHIFKHLHSTATCFDSFNSLCFKIIDKASSKFDLEITESLHIFWIKPNFAM